MVRSILEKKAEGLFIYISSRPEDPWVDYFFKAVFLYIYSKSSLACRLPPPMFAKVLGSEHLYTSL